MVPPPSTWRFADLWALVLTSIAGVTDSVTKLVNDLRHTKGFGESGVPLKFFDSTSLLLLLLLASAFFLIALILSFTKSNGISRREGSLRDSSDGLLRWRCEPIHCCAS